VPPFRSFVLVSRGQIARNFRTVRAAVGPEVEVLGVVKADAYGHGAVEVARVLVAEGARWLAVSSVDEGITLRCAGIGARILVMAGFLPDEKEALAEHNLTPAIHALEEIRELDDLARRTGKPAAYHLKIDTGMHRLGTLASGPHIAAAVNAAPHARFEGLMTHFASAADYTSPQTGEQAGVFHRVLGELSEAGLRPRWVHMASTNAVGYGRRETWHNLVRAGHAIYGYLSPPRGEAPRPVIDVTPALCWKARILEIKEIPEGALVGYGGSYRAPRPMRIAVVGAGYADGIFHRLSNRGRMIAGGKLVPILGTVSMDLTTIDVSHSAALGRGDEVTLLGAEAGASLDAQQIARIAGTISYNILCSISARVRRLYVE
jgi:alanine racemase